MDKNTFNFKGPLLDLAGKPFLTPGSQEPLSLGSQLAPALAQHTKGDALKLYSWALDIYKDADLTLDKSDQITLKDFIKESGLQAILKAQLLEVLNK